MEPLLMLLCLLTVQQLCCYKSIPVSGLASTLLCSVQVEISFLETRPIWEASNCSMLSISSTVHSGEKLLEHEAAQSGNEAAIQQGGLEVPGHRPSPKLSGNANCSVLFSMRLTLIRKSGAHKKLEK